MVTTSFPVAVPASISVWASRSPLIASREQPFEDQEVRHQEQGYEHGRDVPSRAEPRRDIDVPKYVREVDRADNVEEPDQSQRDRPPGTQGDDREQCEFQLRLGDLNYDKVLAVG